MIENLVVFALGALVATFLALLVIPVIWRRAARLIEQRIRTTTPLSMAEIKADKDLDRADYAVQLRKVEVRYDEVKTLAAERQIELGRRESRVLELETELDGREATIGELEARIEDLQGTILGLERQITLQATSLKEKQQAIAEANDALRATRHEIEEVSTTSTSRQVEIAALTTQLENYKSRVEELRAELATRSVESEGHASEVDELRGVLKGRDARIKVLADRVERRRALSLERRKRSKELAELLAAQRERVAEKTAALSAAALTKLKQEEDIRKLQKERAELMQMVGVLESRLASGKHEPSSHGQSDTSAAAPAAVSGLEDGEAAQLRENIADLAARITRLAAEEGGDEVRALIDAVSADSRRKDQAGSVQFGKRNNDHRIPLAERIKEVDLTPGE